MRTSGEGRSFLSVFFAVWFSPEAGVGGEVFFCFFCWGSAARVGQQRVAVKRKKKSRPRLRMGRGEGLGRRGCEGEKRRFLFFEFLGDMV